MERIRIRPLALAAIMGAVAILPMLGGSASASSSRLNAVTLSRGFANVQVLQSLLPNSKENTSTVAQNDGTAPATIVMDIYTPGGVLIPSASVPYTNVPPGATRVFAQASNSGLTPGFRGVGVLSSDQPINALLARDIQQAGTGAKSYSLHSASSTGGTKISLPYVSNSFDGIYSTRFAIANTSTTQACVTIQYSFPGGSKAPVTDNGGTSGGCSGGGYAIPVNGQIAFAPTAIDGAIPMPASTANSLMAATVTSTAPVTVGVDAYLQDGHRKLASYDGFVVGATPATSDVGTTIVMPLAAKLSGYYTQYLISNPNSTDAHAVITYSGNSGPYVVNLTVPANGTANHSVYDTAGGIPEGFVGSAIITSDQPIAAVLFRSQMTAPGSYIDTDTYTAANGVPAVRATTVAKLPLIFRRAYATGANFGYNTWVSVTVANGGTANLTLTSINDTTNAAPGCQAAATYTITKQITGSFIFYQNADSDNGFGQNPSCFWGGMTITSDTPIIAVANATNDLNTGDNDGLYNAFGS